MDRVRERAQGVQQQFVVYRETVLESNLRKRSNEEARKRKNNELRKRKLAEALRKNNIVLAAPNPNDHQGMETARLHNAEQLKRAGVISSSSSSSSSSNFGVMDKKQKMLLLKAKSINAKYGDMARDHDMDRKLAHLEEKDQMVSKMSKITKIKITAYNCTTCRKTYEYAPQGCKESGHIIQRVEATKRFWMCSNCQRRDTCLDKYMTTCCSNCGGASWKPTGMKSQRVVGTNKMSIMNAGHGIEFNFGRGSKY